VCSSLEHYLPSYKHAWLLVCSFLLRACGFCTRVAGSCVLWLVFTVLCWPCVYLLTFIKCPGLWSSFGLLPGKTVAQLVRVCVYMSLFTIWFCTANRPQLSELTILGSFCWGAVACTCTTLCPLFTLCQLWPCIDRVLSYYKHIYTHLWKVYSHFSKCSGCNRKPLELPMLLQA
jgi:hypothetical protein